VNKQIKEWMYRVAEEKRKMAKELIRRADALHFQTTYYDDMTAIVQEKVIRELKEDLDSFGWVVNLHDETEEGGLR
jgi:hypothetical protein